jgi:hypothetical protein
MGLVAWVRSCLVHEGVPCSRPRFYESFHEAEKLSLLAGKVFSFASSSFLDALLSLKMSAFFVNTYE